MDASGAGICAKIGQCNKNQCIAVIPLESSLDSG